MPHHIEHPRHIGDANKMVLDALSDAYQVALQLAGEGHQIQAVCSGLGQPQIWIRDSELTARFASYAAFRARDCNGQYRIRCATRQGVAINWIDRKPNRRKAA